MSRTLRRRLRRNREVIVYWLMFHLSCGTIAWISLFRTLEG